MKKNILTIIIMAIVLINTILTAVLIFAIVPTAVKTNKLVSQVAAIVNLELEAPTASETVAVSDIATYELSEKLTINLKSTDDTPHYALMFVSLSMNSKSDDYKTFSEKMSDYDNQIEEIVTEEFGKYTVDQVSDNKAAIKEAILNRLKELFQSDFIINISFGNMVLS